jgi:hypothetical protein
MSHTSTVNQAFLNKRAQSHLKSVRALFVETWKVLIPICHVPELWKRDASNLKGYHISAKFKHEVIRCAEEKGNRKNRKPAAIFGVNESNVRVWRKHNAAISGREGSRRKFTGPKKGQFPEVDDAVFAFFFFKRDTRRLFVSYDLHR